MPLVHGDAIQADGVPDKTLDWTNLWRDDDVQYNYLWHTMSQGYVLGVQFAGEYPSNSLHYEEPRKPVMHQPKEHHRIVPRDLPDDQGR